MYQYLALDMDGTLLTSSKIVTSNTQKALVEIQKRGVKLILCTGRPTYGVMPTAQLLEMDKYEGMIITYNGGMIIDCKTLDVLSSHLVSPELFPYFYKLAHDNALTIMSYKDDCIISENSDDPYVRYVATNNKMPSVTVRNFLDVINFPVPKCLIVGDPSRIAALETEMSTHLQGQANAFRSEPFLLELVPANVDKGQALLHLTEMLNIRPDELVACGDGFNDVSMLMPAGLKVAMANAQPPVKAIADYIAPSNDNEGIVDVIQKFF